MLQSFKDAKMIKEIATFIFLNTYSQGKATLGISNIVGLFIFVSSGEVSQREIINT